MAKSIVTPEIRATNPLHEISDDASKALSPGETQPGAQATGETDMNMMTAVNTLDATLLTLERSASEKYDGAPIEGRGAHAFTDTEGAWENAVRVELQARSAMDAEHARSIVPANAARRAGLLTLAEMREAEDRFGEYASAHLDAVNKLSVCLAPDLAAILYKLEIADSTEMFDGSAQPIATSVISDLKRLVAGTWTPSLAGWANGPEAMAPAQSEPFATRSPRQTTETISAASWDETLATVTCAKQHLRELEATLPENETSDAAILKAVGELIEPLNQLIQHVPAPTAGAISTKLDFYMEFGELAESDFDLDEWIKAIADDARRLREAASETAFTRALAAYDAARAVEVEYDRDTWRPAYEAEQAGRGKIPQEIGDLDERHGDVVSAAETAFMNLPADTAEHVLIKALVAWSGGRETQVYDDAIWADVARFTGRSGR